MAIKVPVYQEQVKEQPQVPQAPRITAAPASAFGIQEAQAAGQMGEAVNKLGTQLGAHILEQEKWKAEQAAYDAANRFRQESTALLYDQTPIPIKGVDGKEYQIPSGILNRKLTQADGALVDFNTRINPIREKIAKDLQNPYAQRMFARQAATYEEGYRNAVVRHQAQEYNSAVVGTFEAAIEAGKADAGQVTDPLQLNTIIARDGGILDTVERLGKFKGETPAQISVRRAKAIYDATDNAAVNTLMQTGDITKAQAVMDSVKDQIPADKFNDLDDKLKRVNKRLSTEAGETMRFAKTGVEMEIARKVASGEISNVTDLDKLAYGTDGVTPIVGREFYVSQMKAIQAPKKYTTAQKNLAYENLIKEYYGLNPTIDPDNPASLGVVEFNDDKSAEKIIAFREKLTTMADRFEPGVYQDLVKRTEAAYQEAKKNPEKFNAGHNLMRGAVRTIMSVGGVAGFSAVAIPMFLKRMENQKPAPENVSAALRQSLADAANTTNPGSMLREKPTNYTVNGAGNLSYSYPLPSEEAPDVTTKVERVNVKRKSDGKVGSIPRQNYDSSKYDLA